MENLDALTADPRSYLAAADPAVRRLAVSLLAPGVARPETREAVAACLGDDDPTVRASAAEALAGAGRAAVAVLTTAAEDEHPAVAEAAVFALGEIGDPATVSLLLDIAAGEGAKLVREGAVAALGAIGDDRAVPLLVALAGSGPPQIRRRAVVALTAFDGSDAEAAIKTARRDRNPMVREAAEAVLGAEPVDPSDLLRARPC